MEQITKEQAIKIAESGIWKKWTNEEIVKFQLYQKKLCMDFHRFHEAVEKVFDRPVFTHEFARHDLLVAEYEKRRPKPTLEDIIELIPAEKRIVIFR